MQWTCFFVRYGLWEYLGKLEELRLVGHLDKEGIEQGVYDYCTHNQQETEGKNDDQ